MPSEPLPAESAREEALAGIAAWIRSAGSVVALTGAGISTESGIQDFRGPRGLWTLNPKAERLSDIRHYMNDPEVRALSWKSRLEHPAWTAEPNSGHRALAELERRGKLDALITQNIDGLHQAAGNSPQRVVEIHGTIREVVCMSCGERAEMQRALDRVRAGESDPGCRTCGGILKSATISFGQPLIDEDFRRSQRAARDADVFLALGTSLTVYPVAALPQVAIDAGARVVIVNEQQTPYDEQADAVVRGRIGPILARMIELL